MLTMHRAVKYIMSALVILQLLSIGSSASDVVYSWHDNKKDIALTFDDGPHPIYTKEILDILDEYGVRATFFVIGQNIEWYGGIVEMEYGRGHEIGNHTYSHYDLRNLTEDEACDEIFRAEEKIYEDTETRPKLLRPPGGMLDREIIDLAESFDYTVVCWSIDTLDWAHTPSDVIATSVLQTVQGGDIILFHDYVSGKSTTPDALRKIIPTLLERGYNFVTVSELICGK